MTLQELMSQEIFETIVEIMQTKEDADVVLGAVGLAKSKRPRLRADNWHNFWMTVCQRIQDGALPNGTDLLPLVQAVARQRRSNPKLKRFLTSLDPLPEVTRVRRPRPAKMQAFLTSPDPMPEVTTRDREVPFKQSLIATGQYKNVLKRLYVGRNGQMSAALTHDLGRIDVPHDVIPHDANDDQRLEIAFRHLTAKERLREFFVVALLIWPEDPDLRKCVEPIAAAFATPAKAAPQLWRNSPPGSASRDALRRIWSELRESIQHE